MYVEPPAMITSSSSRGSTFACCSTSSLVSLVRCYKSAVIRSKSPRVSETVSVLPL
jgi:hypothetical protein